MAGILNDNTIMFDDGELAAAWNNAPAILDADPTEERMCYVCKWQMQYEISVDKQNIPTAWCIDFLDFKHFSTAASNLIAIHAACVDLKPKDNVRKIVKKIKSLAWKKTNLSE